jgi:ABC-2 type transport system permease protein
MKSNITPIYLRELKAIFYSPVAWLVLFAFYLLAGYFWAASVTAYASYSYMSAGRGGGDMRLMDYLISPYLGNLTVIFIFLLPLVSMRLLSEEKKTGTIESLFTWPFSDLDIVLGKWFASLTLLAAMLLPLLLFPLLIADKCAMPWAVVAAGFGGLFLLGGAFLAVGLFTSALTENQVIAAALGFGSLLFLFILGWMSNEVSGAPKALLEQLAIMNHFQNMSKGVLNLKDVSYFIFFTVLMLFGALRVLESKKWR